MDDIELRSIESGIMLTIIEASILSLRYIISVNALEYSAHNSQLH